MTIELEKTYNKNDFKVLLYVTNDNNDLKLISGDVVAAIDNKNKIIINQDFESIKEILEANILNDSINKFDVNI